MNAKNELLIVRVVNAPREKVWRACKEPDALKEWWGLPKDATMPVCNVDFRVGGFLHFEAVMPGYEGMWFKSIYREIVEGEKLVMDQHKSDETGREIVSADWPVSKITIRFEDMNGKTKLTITHTGMASEVHPVEKYHQGWSESLDRLEESVARG